MTDGAAMAYIVMGIAGFFIGMTLVYIEHGNILKFPYHLAAGSILAVLIFLQFLISKKITQSAAALRNRHFITGIIIVCLYFIQVILGVTVLEQHEHKKGQDYAHYEYRQTSLF